VPPPPTSPPPLAQRTRKAAGVTPPRPPVRIETHPETLAALRDDLARRRLVSGEGDRPEAHWDEVATVRAPLGRVAGARSGDKGGNANVGVWTRTDEAYDWLSWFLTVDRLRALMPAETDGFEVERHELPNLRACNFVVRGLLGRGVAATARTDPQAKGFGEYLRAKVVDVPEHLLPPA
jgi:hypothetical protein